MLLKFLRFGLSDVLTKENIAEPMRDIRRALLEADVGFDVELLVICNAFPHLCNYSQMLLMFSGKSASRTEICSVCQ